MIYIALPSQTLCNQIISQNTESVNHCTARLLSSSAKAVIILVAVEMTPGGKLLRVDLIKNAVTDWGLL